MFDSIARYGLDDIALKLLRSKVGHGFWECVGKSASKHNDELHVSTSVLVFVGADAMHRVYGAH